MITLMVVVSSARPWLTDHFGRHCHTDGQLGDGRVRVRIAAHPARHRQEPGRLGRQLAPNGWGSGLTCDDCVLLGACGLSLWSPVLRLLSVPAGRRLVH
jgi:hypothetical protein